MKWPVLLIGAVLVLGVLIFAVSYGLPNHSASTSVSSSTLVGTSTVILPNVPTALYTDAEHGFSIERAESMAPETSGFDGFLSSAMQPIVGFSLPQDVFQGTNLVEAGIYIGISSDTQAINSCLTPSDEGEHSLGSKMISGEEFQVFNSLGAAAGNMYDKTAYRTLRNGHCYELVELMHSGNIGNYPVGKVKEFDPDAIRSILDVMLSTFSFTGYSGSGVEGKVKITCPIGTDTSLCKSQIHTIEAYQGIAPIALFKTASDGSFHVELPPGKYELRVDTASSTRCASVGVVVTENSYLTTDISCDESTQE